MPRNTPNLNLFVPDPGQSGIAAELNSNYDAIDGTMDPIGGHKHTGAPGAAPKIAVANIDATGTPGSTTFLRGDGQWAASGGGAGVTDHGDLTGLADDDHLHYPTQARGDARWLQRASNLADIANAAAARTALDAAQTAHAHAAADVSSGVMAPARLGAGAASSSTYLRGDGQWATVAATGVGGSGTPGRAAFWSAVSTLSGIANSIFFNTTTGYLGIGTESPTVPIHIVANALGGGSSGTTFSSNVTITTPLTGTANPHIFQATYDPTLAHTGSRIWSGIRATATVLDATPGLTLPLAHRGVNAIASNAATAILSGASIGCLGQVSNLGSGSMATASAVSGLVSNSGTGVMTIAAALRANRPSNSGTIGDVYGLYVENQTPSSGTVTGGKYGIYQEGTADQNTYKGLSQFDGKATFAQQPAGIEKLFGWYDETTPTAATLGPTYPITSNLTLVRSEGWAEVVATGAAVQFDIQYKRGAAAWTSIFSALPQFAVGANQRTAGTLSVTTLNAGDVVRRRWLGTPAGIADVSTYLAAVTR